MALTGGVLGGGNVPSGHNSIYAVQLITNSPGIFSPIASVLADVGFSFSREKANMTPHGETNPQVVISPEVLYDDLSLTSTYDENEVSHAIEDGLSYMALSDNPDTQTELQWQGPGFVLGTLDDWIVQCHVAALKFADGIKAGTRKMDVTFALFGDLIINGVNRKALPVPTPGI